ncbi:MAG: hypothetical protein JW769_03010 [Parachlamydiales bacterium]|nr:hypothetical protein [Parachlamydiales bacterium]
MKITDEILSLPPYISTSWKNIQSLSMPQDRQFSMLIITLSDGKRVEIPDLGKELIETIFDAHARFLEKNQSEAEKISHSFKLGIPFSLDGNSESFNTSLLHNPNQADTADLPKEILEKIISIGKIIGIDNMPGLSEAIKDCNCIHCQIARAFKGSSDTTSEETVSDEDLKFTEWNISQKEEKLYRVTNPLDEHEYYDVFLGNPIGCTCGKKDCEHIMAVLRS